MFQSTLNEQQAEAVNHVDGPMIVLAGAGSGKTRVITQRIGNLLANEIPGHYVLAIAFTNKAATEMRERAEQQYPGSGVTISTFHSFCCRVLRQYISHLGTYERNFIIMDSDDVKNLVKKIIKELGYDPTAFSPREVAGAISGAKNRDINADTYAQRAFSYRYEIIAKVYQQYEATKVKMNMLDFDDLLGLTLKLMKTKPDVLEMLQDRYRYIMIDEYQDTNRVQYQLVNTLASKYRNLCITGDPDQAIYSWRGATIRNILDFEKDYPDHKIVVLGKNYRSTKTIIGAADSLIKHNSKRKDKELWTDNEEGEKITVDYANNEMGEAKNIVTHINRYRDKGKDYGEMAVVYRINALTRAIEEAMVQNKVPYQIVGGLGFYERKEIKDMIAYLRLAMNPADDMAFLRVINEPSRGLGLKFIEAVQVESKRRDVSLYEALADADYQEKLNPRQQKAVIQFFTVLESVREHHHSAAESVEAVLKESGYIDHLRMSSKEEDIDRIENLNELVSAATLFDQQGGELADVEGLEGFLENIALVTDVDRMDDEQNKVTLMSLHAVKGLEFPVVFIAGVEQDILPHRMASEADDRDDEEERRLFYVGITRAMQKLHLCYTGTRMIYGRTTLAQPSPFLNEIDDIYLEHSAKGGPFGSRQFPGQPGGAGGHGGTPSGKGNEWSADYDEFDQSVDFDDVSQETISIGDWVEHNIFGSGQVLGTQGHGGNAKIEVQFAQAGRKKMAASFLRRRTD